MKTTFFLFDNNGKTFHAHLPIPFVVICDGAAAAVPY